MCAACLAALRAFLTSVRDYGPAEQYRTRQQQQRAALQAAGQEPLDPPLPMWETEAEQVAKLQQHKAHARQQRMASQQQQQQQQQQTEPQRQQQQQQQQRPEGPYVQLVRVDGSIGRVPQLASKL
jgi:hypothetical protein